MMPETENDEHNATSTPENAPFSQDLEQVVTIGEAPEGVPQSIPENASLPEDLQQAVPFRRVPQNVPQKDGTPGKRQQIYTPDSQGRMRDSETEHKPVVHTDKMLSIVKRAGPAINLEMHSSTAMESSGTDPLCCYRSLRRKKLLAWGGPFREYLAKENYSLFDFIVNNVPFHGIKSIFRKDSGWPRTIFYAVCFTVTGYFFVAVLIRPLVQQFQNHDVNVVTEYVTHKDGIRYPIITVCPKGNGMRCDCQLWKRLACHYSDSNRNLPFKMWTCDLFSFAGNQSTLVDSMCIETWNISSLDWNDDPCGEDLNGEELFNAVIQREQEEGKPYITLEEQIVYGAVRFSTPNINFRFLNHIFPALGQAINFKYLDYTTLDIFNARICVQMRLPPDMKQNFLGTNNGIQIIVNNFMNNLIPTADGAGVDVFIENNHYKPNERVYLHSHSVPASPNQVTSIPYSLQRSSKLKGYGGESSRTCTNERDFRDVCVRKISLRNLFNNCGICNKVQYADYFGFSKSDTEQFYRAFGCETDCLKKYYIPSTSFQECPVRCEVMNTHINGYYPIEQSEYQKELYNLVFDTTTNVTDTRIGTDSFDVIVSQETQSQTLGGLIGTIGGNLNLWFGPDFMNALWFLELIAFGSIHTMFMPSP